MRFSVLTRKRVLTAPSMAQSGRFSHKATERSKISVNSEKSRRGALANNSRSFTHRGTFFCENVRNFSLELNKTHERQRETVESAQVSEGKRPTACSVELRNGEKKSKGPSDKAGHGGKCLTTLTMELRVTYPSFFGFSEVFIDRSSPA